MQQRTGQRLQMLRKRCGLSIRQLSGLAGVTAGMISCIERETSSPSIVTLQKILTSLGTDLASFFGGEPSGQTGPFYPREGMRLVSDTARSYTIIFPRREDIKVELLDEQNN